MIQGGKLRLRPGCCVPKHACVVYTGLPQYSCLPGSLKSTPRYLQALEAVWLLNTGGAVCDEQGDTKYSARSGCSISHLRNHSGSAWQSACRYLLVQLTRPRSLTERHVRMSSSKYGGRASRTLPCRLQSILKHPMLACRLHTTRFPIARAVVMHELCYLFKT